MVGALARLAAIAGLLLLSAPARASVHAEHMSADLKAFAAAHAAAVDIGVTLTPDPGWHTYWINPGDTGLAPDIRLMLAGKPTAGAFTWPAPQRLVYDGVVSFGYDHPITALESLNAPHLAHGQPIEAHIEALVCRDTCEPVTFDLKATVRSRPSQDPFAAARGALPEEIDLKASYAYSADRLHVGFLAPSRPDVAGRFRYPQGVQVFSENDQVLAAAASQSTSVGSRGFSISAEDASGRQAMGPQAFVLVFPDGKAFRTLATPGVVPESVAEQDHTGKRVAAPQAATIIWAILLALAGGLVLNLMPCVFPVLSMKLLALSRSGHDHAAARREALIYGAGVLLSFLALAGLVEVARSLGSAVGWGFQLQSPLMTAAMAVLMLLIGLNLSGVFEIGGTLQALAGGKLAGAHPAVAAFSTGVLAVVVAAPCSAPFMATATGVALGQGGWASMAIFAALGAGFAAPFVIFTWLLTAIPGLSRFLPKPGPWMDWLRKLLAVPMYLSALWMAWVFWQQSSVAGLALLLAGLLIAASAIALKRVPRAARGMALATGLALVISGAIQPHVASRVLGDERGRLAFSVSELAALRAQNRPVLVDFTAAWCITCKVNERVALANPSVQRALKDTHTQLMVGDWTRRDESITAFLSGFGRSGVPLYLYYAPGRADAVILPQILTPRDVLTVVNTRHPPR